ncbi:MAG: DMT family transporter [Anaerolineales bacterium]|nr:DMT family transporter [Anaerolineales bacterium]
MKKGQAKGVRAALASALFLGFAPIFGRQAILLGLSPLAVVALRTSMAAGLLVILVTIIKREYLYVFPVGLAGCFLAGTINGLGSILYYMALGRLSASVGQFLYSLYPIFVVLWAFLDREPPSKLTLLRMGLATLAVVFITNTSATDVDMVGVAMMLASAALYALHLPINQRVLYEVPAPTVAMYTLLAMSAVVVPAYFLFDRQWPVGNVVWWPVIGLTLVTFFSRLTLFLGVKQIGGLQTALLGLSELLVTVSVGYFWLGEQLTWQQWLGVAGLAASLLLVKFDKEKPNRGQGSGGWLSWIRPPRPHIPSDIPWGPQS